MQDLRKNIYLVAAGGTGGHIFPALSICDAIKEEDTQAEIHFVGTASGLENKIIPNKGYPLHYLSIGRLNSNVTLNERLLTAIKLPWSLIQSFVLILRLKPRLVLGAGGHASGPLLLAASFLRTPCYFFEPNAYPGLANRWLARFVDKGHVVFKEALKFMKLKKYRLDGYPLRKQMVDLNIKKRDFTKTDDDFHFLIFGGSQGARSLNRTMIDFFKTQSEMLKKMRIVLQTGERDHQEVLEAIKQLPNEIKSKIEVKDFIHNIEYYYCWAHLALCRSGMGTIAELAAAGLPAVLVPLPTAADNHQQKNAEQLTGQGAALMILDKELTASRLAETIKAFADKPKLLDAMKENAHKLHKTDSARSIAKDLIQSSLDKHPDKS